MRMKRILTMAAVLAVLIFSDVFFIAVRAAKAQRITGLEQFPASYRAFLEPIAEKHPNWTFTALITGLDWEQVIHMETKDNHSRSLISNTMPAAWKCMESTCYNAETKSFISKEREDRMCASEAAVSYAMDPRNYLCEELIFQFENISYDKDIHTMEGIEKIFEDSDFSNKTVTYKDKNGKEYNMEKTYADLVMAAAQSAKVSPYHLASRIRQETLGSLTYKSVAGVAEGFEGIYNFYNIGATAAEDPTINGLTFAGRGKDTSFQRPWTDPEKAITGGALWIGNGYINSGQNTLYLEKFDVDNSDGRLYWHQYMTFIMTPVTEQAKVYQAYRDIGLLDYRLNFIIPVYKNMPDSPAPIPDSNYEHYLTVDEKTMVYLEANPAFSEILTRINAAKTASEPEEESESQNHTVANSAVPEKNENDSERSKHKFPPFVIAVILLCGLGILVGYKSVRNKA